MNADMQPMGPVLGDGNGGSPVPYDYTFFKLLELSVHSWSEARGKLNVGLNSIAMQFCIQLDQGDEVVRST